MTEDLEARIKALEEKLSQSKYPKVSSIQASGELKEKLDTFRDSDVVTKETFEGIVWKIIDQAERVPSLEKEISSLEDKLLESANEIGNLRMQVKELEEKVSDLEYQIEAEAYRQQDDI